MNVKPVWATPDGDKLIAYMARVSNPGNQDNENIEGLIRYMLREGHVSPFDMVNLCIEVNTTRDIGRQLLRHSSIKFQEFSQRYADVSSLGELEYREARLQDTKNRQNSLPCDDPRLAAAWLNEQKRVEDAVHHAYTWAIDNGIAKEQARAVLPEGMTPSRLYANGTLRSWIYYLKSRLHPSTQAEHRELAKGVWLILQEQFPVVANAAAPIIVGELLA